MDKKNKKNISKRPENKKPTCLQWNIVIYDDTFESLLGLSNVGTDELVKEPLSRILFCCFRLKDQILDHTTLCRFYNEIVAKKVYEILLKKINKELEKHQAIVKRGVIVNANITVRVPCFQGAPIYVVRPLC
ncbi:MAG: transposase [Flavobacteriales bacterium Tduv]